VLETAEICRLKGALTEPHPVEPEIEFQKILTEARLGWTEQASENFKKASAVWKSRIAFRQYGLTWFIAAAEIALQNGNIRRHQRLVRYISPVMDSETSYQTHICFLQIRGEIIHGVREFNSETLAEVITMMRLSPSFVNEVKLAEITETIICNVHEVSDHQIAEFFKWLELSQRFDFKLWILTHLQKWCIEKRVARFGNSLAAAKKAVLDKTLQEWPEEMRKSYLKSL